MKKFNLNQKKAISDLFINLSNSIITVGVIVPLISGIRWNINNLIIFILTIAFTFILVLLSNILLK